MSSVAHVSTSFPKLLWFDLEEVCKALGYKHYVTSWYEEMSNTHWFFLCLAEQK